METMESLSFIIYYTFLIGEGWIPFAELPELAKIALTGVDNPNIQTLTDALSASARQSLLEKQTLPAISGSKD